MKKIEKTVCSFEILIKQFVWCQLRTPEGLDHAAVQLEQRLSGWMKVFSLILFFSAVKSQLKIQLLGANTYIALHVPRITSRKDVQDALNDQHCQFPAAFPSTNPVVFVDCKCCGGEIGRNGCIVGFKKQWFKG